MDSEIFEKSQPTRLFFRLAIPSMITMAFGALYQIADGITSAWESSENKVYEYLLSINDKIHIR